MSEDPKLALATLAVLRTQPELDLASAETLAKAVLAATPAPAPDPVPATPAVTPTVDPKPEPAAGPPAAPVFDHVAAASMNPNQRAVAVMAHERALKDWLAVRTSWTPPANEAAHAAQAELRAMRSLPEATTDTERVERAAKREKLMQVLHGVA